MTRLKKFLQAQGMETFIEEQRLIRFGTPRMVELDGPEYATITIEQIVSTHLQAQRDEITRIEQTNLIRTNAPTWGNSVKQAPTY